MKLLFILSIGLDKPGPSVHILDSLLRGLAEKGHDISVILQGDSASVPKGLIDCGVKFFPISVAAAGKNNFVLRYIRQLSYAKSVARALKNHADADAVYVHSNTALLPFVRSIKRHIKGAGIVLNVQDIFPENVVYSGIISARNPVCAVMSAMQHKAYRDCDALITLSDDMKATLDSAGAKHTRVIPLWSYGDDVKPVDDNKNAVLKELGDIKDRFLCVYAGNTGSMQNVEIILEAANLMKNDDSIRFIIVGDGARLQYLKDVKARDGLDNVVFLPMQPSYLATSVYSMANVNLITLKKGVVKTAFPSKTTTCCAVGRPIIACVDQDSLYAATIRDMDHCKTVACNDAEALCSAIIEIRDSGATYSEKAREYYAARLSQKAGIEMHEALFRSVARKEKKK